MKRLNRNRVCFWTVLFLLILAKGLWSSAWYDSGVLRVIGQADAGAADITVKWDSGGGYNTYEKKKVALVPSQKDNSLQHIKIAALGVKHQGSEGISVSLLNVYLDSQEFDLATVRPRSILRDRLAIQLTEKNPVYEFYAEANKQIRLVFAHSYYFGQVLVEINGVPFHYDNFSPSGRYDVVSYDYYLVQPDNSFYFEVSLPRYQIERISFLNSNKELPVVLSSASLCEKEICEDLELKSGSNGAINQLIEPNRNMKHFFDPIRFVLRCLSALITIYIFKAVLTTISRSGGWRAMVMNKERPFFWILFLSGCSINLLFLIAFWPGVMSQDSIMIWRAAGLPDIYMNHHPVLNMLFYMFLKGIWNNPAIVCVVQIGMSWFLVSYYFYWIYRQGVKAIYLVPFFLVCCFSLPIHLYNISLWKDNQFSFLVVLWAGLFVWIVHRTRREVHFGVKYLILLLILYIGIGFFRYNGMVYWVIIPVLFFLVGIFDWKKTIIVSCSFLFLVSSMAFVMKNIETIGGLGFLTSTLESHEREFKKKGVANEIIRTGTEYFYILDMDYEKSTPDKWHSYLSDRYAWSFLERSGFGDYFPFAEQLNIAPQIREFVLKIYKESYNTPWKFLVWNPLFLVGLVPVVILCFFWFPRAAVFSVFLISGALPLVLLGILNWRYFYFFYFGLHFLIPLMILDRKLDRNEEKDNKEDLSFG